MTFSDAKVRSLIDAFFVCRWINLEGDRSAGSSPRVLPQGGGSPSARGTGYSNVQICVYTPEGRLLHLLTGFVSASDLVWELCQALVTYEAIQQRPASRSARTVVVRRADQIQRELEGPRRAGASSTRARPRRSVHRHARRDRKILKQHAHARVEDVKTRWLTRGNRAGGFSGNGLVVSDSKPKTLVGFAPVLRAPPWDAMPEALRVAVRAALSTPPPGAAAESGPPDAASQIVDVDDQGSPANDGAAPAAPKPQR